jgi:hypothetical protein
MAATIALLSPRGSRLSIRFATGCLVVWLCSRKTRSRRLGSAYYQVFITYCLVVMRVHRFFIPSLNCFLCTPIVI